MDITRQKPRTSFAGDILKLASGTTIAQLLGILAAPILTRLYAPEAFGLLALFIAISSVFAVIICMGYEYAIMLPEQDSDAANLLGASVGFSLLLSLPTLPIIWIWRDGFAQLVNAPELAKYLWLLPFSILLSGLFAALNYWNSRTKHFGRLSAVRVIQSLATTSTKLGAGYGGYATGGMMIGASVLGQVIATTILGTQIWQDSKRLFFQTVRWQSILKNIKRYHKFPVFYAGSNLVNTISSMVPVFLLSFFFSPFVVGFYALSLRILQMPMDLIGNAIGQVFFQKASEAHQHGQLAPIVEKIFTFLVAIGLFPILMISLIGRDFFIVVFGQNWAEAGVYAQILSVSLALFFVTSPLTMLTAALEKQKFALTTSTALLILRSASLIAAGILSNARLGILLFSISGVLIYGYRMFVINKFAGVPYRKSAEIVFRGVIPFIPVMFLFLLLLTIWKVASWVVVILAPVLMGGYLFYIVLTQKEIVNQLIRANR